MLNICQLFKNKSFIPIFIFKESDKSLIDSEFNNHNFKSLFINNESEIINLFSFLNIKFILLDINNYYTFPNQKSYKKYIEFLKNNFFNVISFEDLFFDNYKSDMIIVPYFGANKVFNQMKIIC